MNKLAEKLRKTALIVNNLIALDVVGFILIFWYAEAKYMVYISLGALGYYLLANILIIKNKLHIYVASLYMVLTMFMFAATISVGLGAGFQMYCLSMIPLLFIFGYMGEQLNIPRSNPILFSILIAVSYFGCTLYVHVSGPIYEIPNKISVFLLGTNSLWVIMLLITYSAYVINLVRDVENKLKKQAIMDELTKLYNRHFMIEQLEKIDKKDAANNWVAILDIDNFKSVNDIYGHNAGDAVLVEVAAIIQRVCSGCVYARWGGEEFLVSSTTERDGVEVMEKLRREVNAKPFEYDGKQINVSITIGVSRCVEDEPVNRWVQRSDKLLYKGKQSGKNQVVSE